MKYVGNLFNWHKKNEEEEKQVSDTLLDKESILDEELTDYQRQMLQASIHGRAIMG